MDNWLSGTVQKSCRLQFDMLKYVMACVYKFICLQIMCQLSKTVDLGLTTGICRLAHPNIV